jgi:ethanolamine-phosphate cytidylyltransferase
MLQARRLGKQLLVGVHSDEEILENKGPTVMTLEERIIAVEGCRWATKSIPSAPYVTSLPWISHYGCHYVVHGDDITSDSSGQDCYRHVKAADRFLVVKRTPGISTTDLVGRMLLFSKHHFIKSLSALLDGKEGPGDPQEKLVRGQDYAQRIKEYATDETGLHPGSPVWIWEGPQELVKGSEASNAGIFKQFVDGTAPRPGQRVVYVDGGFDLFSSGHITFLKCVAETEDEIAKRAGWFEPDARRKRIEEYGHDFGPAYVIAGIHDDEVINKWKGVNYPIMNIMERGLCVLQCKVVFLQLKLC